MQIDPSKVQWDEIDPAKVKWDEPPQDAKRKLAAETGAGASFVIGAGKTGDAMWEGLKQGGLGMGAIMSELLPDRLKRAAQEEITKHLLAQEKRQASKAAEYKHLQDESPIATTLGEAAPIAAAPLARVVQGGKLAATMVNSGVSSALPAALEYGTAGERGQRAAIAGGGGAAGGALAKGAEKVFGKALKPVTKVESQSLDDAIAAADRIGVRLTPGQLTGNKAVRAVEERLAKLPGSSGAMQEFSRQNERALARAASGAIGEPVEEILPDTFARASKRIGGEFERLSNTTNVAISEPFTNALATLQAQQGALGKFADPQIDDLIGKGLDLAQKGNVDGKTYQLIRSRLSTKASDAMKSGNSEMGQALKTVRDALDEAAESGLGAGDKEAWQIARRQWAALKTLEKGNVVEGGKVSAGRLKEALRTARPKDYKEGRLDGPLADIATYAEQFKPGPDSGTAGNLFVQGLLTGVNPVAGAASVAAPWAAQKAMFSGAGRNYLTKGRELTALERALMDRAARASALGASGEAFE